MSKAASEELPSVLNHPNIIEALDAGEKYDTHGFTFISQGGTEEFYSWRKLREEAMRRAAHFRAYGMKKGDRLALILPEGKDFVPTFLGAMWAGIVPVPMYPPLSMGKLDAYVESCVNIMRKAGPTYLATTEKIKSIIWSAAGRVPSLRGVIDEQELRNTPDSSASQQKVIVDPNDLAFLQFTSGSTSLPKGVEVTHGNLHANSRCIIQQGLKFVPFRDIGVSWLPLYHDMGLIGFVIAPVLHSIDVTFIPTMSFVRNANIWMETIHKKRATTTFGPNFGYALAAKRAKKEFAEKWDLSCMRSFGCGAEPINPEVMANFVKALEPAGVKPTMMLPAYGMAEATLAVSFVGLDEAVQVDSVDKHTYQSEKLATAPADGADTLQFVSCGKTFAEHEVGVFDDEARRLSERQVGELWLKGPSITRGYFEDKEATSKAIHNGWLKTGDLGYIAQGNIYVTGRKKDLIIINGRNYDPHSIEWLADDIQDVRKGSTVAFSRPGSTSEELVVVVESRTQNPAAVKNAVRERIQEELQLTCADVVIAAPSALPKTSSGKVQRQKTRQQYLDGVLGLTATQNQTFGGERGTVAKHLALSLFSRGRNRAKRIVQHTQEIKSLSDAVQKAKLLGRYTLSTLRIRS